MTDISVLKQHIEELDAMFEEEYGEDRLKIDVRDQVLFNALREQVALQMKYDEIYRTACWLVNEMETECESKFSIAFSNLLNNSQKALGVTEAKQYALSDKDYVDARRILSSAKYVKGKVEGTMDALTTRKYVLKNMCDALESGNDSHII